MAGSDMNVQQIARFNLFSYSFFDIGERNGTVRKLMSGDK